MDSTGTQADCSLSVWLWLWFVVGLHLKARHSPAETKKMPALRITLCLLRWNSLAATQSPPKNSRVTLRMGKTLEALTAPVEERRGFHLCFSSPGNSPAVVVECL